MSNERLGCVEKNTSTIPQIMRSGRQEESPVEQNIEKNKTDPLPGMSPMDSKTAGQQIIMTH